MGRRVGGTVEEGAGDRFVAEGVEGVGFGSEDTCGDRNVAAPTAGQPSEASARPTHKRQFGRAVLARLPRGRFAPPGTIERDVPRVVRGDAVSVVPVDLSVQVHVGDGQGSLAERIIAY